MTLKDIAYYQNALKAEYNKVIEGFKAIEGKEWVTTKELKAVGLGSYTRNCDYNDIETKIELFDLNIPMPTFVRRNSLIITHLAEQDLLNKYYNFTGYWYDLKDEYSQCDKNGNRFNLPKITIKGKRKYYKVSSIFKQYNDWF